MRGLATSQLEDVSVELRIAGSILAAVGRVDEGAPLARSGEDDVARLVTDAQGPHDRAVTAGRMELHDAHAVGQVVDDPDLAVAPGRDRDRLEPDRHRAPVDEPAVLDREDLEVVVRVLTAKR
jgi:hypothetical protein